MSIGWQSLALSPALSPAPMTYERACWESQGLRKGNPLSTANPEALCFLQLWVLGEGKLLLQPNCISLFEFLGPPAWPSSGMGAQFEILGSVRQPWIQITALSQPELGQVASVLWASVSHL